MLDYITATISRNAHKSVTIQVDNKDVSVRVDLVDLCIIGQQHCKCNSCYDNNMYTIIV